MILIIKKIISRARFDQSDLINQSPQRMQRDLCQSGFTADLTSLVMTSSFIQGSASSKQNCALRLCIFFFQFFKDKGVDDSKLPLKLCFYIDNICFYLRMRLFSWSDLILTEFIRVVSL